MSYLLEIDWEATAYFRKKYSGRLTPRGGSLYYYTGEILPKDLEEYRTDDYTYARWIEDDEREKNKQPHLKTKISKTQFTPRDHQKDAAKKIYQSYMRGDSGFLLASKTGVGKTLSSVVAITAIAKKNGYNENNKAKVLIVCPKSVIPVWKQTFQAYGMSSKYMRIMITNYQQLNKLLKAPAEPKPKKGTKRRRKSTKTKNRTTAAKGTPIIDFNFIVFDESHYLKNYGSSAMSLAAANIAKLETKYGKGKTPYVIYSTATPGSTPLNFSIMAKIVAPLINLSTGANTTPSTWGAFLSKNGFAVSKGKTGWSWATVPWFGKNSKDPEERKKYELAVRKNKMIQRKDASRIGKALTKPNAPFLMQSPKDIAGWPEQQVIPFPIELTHSQKPIYEEAWSRFRNFLKLTPAKSDPKAALVENLRYRQKSSLLKIDAMVDFIAEQVESDKQVFVSVEFMDTIDMLKEALQKKKIPVSEVSGRNTAEREQERLKFQKGTTKVVLCTVVAGVSFHAGEILPDGSTATTNDRVTILYNIRNNPNDSIQALGRCHRDGMNSITYVPFFVDTIDEKVVVGFTNKTSNMNMMIGSKTEEAEELETVFRKSLEEYE